MKAIYGLFILFALTACSNDNNESNSTADNSGVPENSSPAIDSGTSANDNSAGDSNVEESDSIVYIETGAIQCEADGVSQAETAQLLTVNGINVIDSQCGDLTGVVVAAQCGLPGTDINIHTIPFQNLAGALALGFKSVTALKQDEDAGYMVRECKG